MTSAITLPNYFSATKDNFERLLSCLEYSSEVTTNPRGAWDEDKLSTLLEKGSLYKDILPLFYAVELNSQIKKTLVQFDEFSENVDILDHQIDIRQPTTDLPSACLEILKRIESFSNRHELSVVIVMKFEAENEIPMNVEEADNSSADESIATPVSRSGIPDWIIVYVDSSRIQSSLIIDLGGNVELLCTGLIASQRKNFIQSIEDTLFSRSYPLRACELFLLLYMCCCFNFLLLLIQTVVVVMMVLFLF